jgi:hypothetical protein
LSTGSHDQRNEVQTIQRRGQVLAGRNSFKTPLQNNEAHTKMIWTIPYNHKNI